MAHHLEQSLENSVRKQALSIKYLQLHPSNGLAESTVGKVKKALKTNLEDIKREITKMDVGLQLMRIRNMPREDGSTPSTLFYNRIVRDDFPRVSVLREDLLAKEESMKDEGHQRIMKENRKGLRQRKASLQFELGDNLRM